MGLKVLVTGANGFVGRNLIYQLSQESDIRIIATDIQETLVPLNGRNQKVVDYLSGDLANKQFIRVLSNLSQFDAIIHLAAILSQAEDGATYLSVMESNINATMLLLEIARQHKSRFVFPSTALIYENAQSPFKESYPSHPEAFYPLSKHLCEELINFYHRKYGVNYAILRAGVLYGPGQRGTMFIPSIIDALVNKREFPMTKGEQIRDFVFIEDFIHLLRQTLDHQAVCGVFNAGSGDGIAMCRVAEIVEQLTGTKGLVRIGALPYRQNEVFDYRLDISKACKTFRWTPKTSLEEGLRKTIEHFRQQTQ